MSGWGKRMEKRAAEGGFGRVMRVEVEGLRFSTSSYPDEGPSNCNLESSVSYGEPLRKHGEIDGANRIQHLEKDRSELLRKLDELKEQLSRSCDVADKPKKEKVPLHARMAASNPYTGSCSDTWFPGGSSTPNMAPWQFFAADKHPARSPYVHHRPDPFLFTNDPRIPGFDDPFDLKRAPHQVSGQYATRRRFSGHYFDINSDRIKLCTADANFHQPSCFCFHCCERHQEAPVLPAVFSNKRVPDVLYNPNLHQHQNPGAFATHVHNSRVNVSPPLNFHGAQSHPRQPRELNSKMDGFSHNQHRTVVLTGGGSYCRPIAHGAPFFSCFNCFEVLQVPKKVMLMGKNKQKIQCGACSTVINLSFVNKKRVLSVSTEVAQVLPEVDDSCSGMIKEHTSYFHDHMNQISANFCSDDYDNSGYNFQTVDADPVALPRSQGLNLKKHQEMNSISPPPPGSPLQQHFDYSSNIMAADRFGKGNQSIRLDQEKVVINEANTWQNSMKDASLATEIEVSFHEYSNTGLSQDSGDANREDSQLKINKGRESFFTNATKKSFEDFSGSNRTSKLCRSNVNVNGHLIPDHLVTKAEKLAGPIHPGQYWYDFQAGFWGIMGGPCLGIIPPFIEEFNYSMAEDCAGGNTGVYVNGRELHQKDLDLLSGRGLPTDRDRSYIIDISGKVLEEDTSEELHSLGKLAPTVEKVKHGFGMKAPKAVPNKIAGPSTVS